LEFGRERYDVGKEGLRNRNIWARLILWKLSLLLSQERSRGREGRAHPKAPQGHKYNPLERPRGVSFVIRRYKTENKKEIGSKGVLVDLHLLQRILHQDQRYNV
jgi:hypothetical protein